MCQCAISVLLLKCIQGVSCITDTSFVFNVLSLVQHRKYFPLANIIPSSLNDVLGNKSSYFFKGKDFSRLIKKRRLKFGYFQSCTCLDTAYPFTVIKPVYLCNQETNVVYLILVSRIERQTVLTFLTDFVQTSQFLPGCFYRSSKVTKNTLASY